MNIPPGSGELFNDITALTQEVMEKSEAVFVLNSSPKFISLTLFRRLWSNQRGFALLWKDKKALEAVLVLRAAIEATICLMACMEMKDEFVTLIRQDAVETIKRRIKMYEDDGMNDMADKYRNQYNNMVRIFSESKNSKVLNWKELSKVSGCEFLYTIYRQVSGTHAHVTGLSVLRGVIGADGDGLDLQKKLEHLSIYTSLPQMAIATAMGCSAHTNILGFTELEDKANKIVERMNQSSKDWFYSE